MTSNANTQPGQSDHGTAPPPISPLRALGADWFHVVVFEWMWRGDGLGLKPGADLMIYATIYRASAHGGGAYLATNASMGKALGYPRETVSRVVNRLLKAGLVWVAGRVQNGHGGKAVKCYAVSQGAIDAVMARMSARPLSRDVPDPQQAGDDNQVSGANVTDCHIGPNAHGVPFQQNVTNRHATDSQCDGPSRSQCDDPSHVTERHIGKNMHLPAQTELFDMPLISTYHISTDQWREGGTNQACEGNGAPAPLALPAGVDEAGLVAQGPIETELVAFQSLLQKSLLPVDAEYVGKNLKEFVRLVAEGIPEDVILAAYDDYAAYHRKMEIELGECRPMHLLKWLRQSPNKNIQYVLNSRDEEWQRAHAGAKRERAVGARSGRTAKTSRPTHENPDFTKCRDHGEALWFVTDERGSRRVEGSKGVESLTQARTLYERMYQSEAR